MYSIFYTLIWLKSKKNVVKIHTKNYSNNQKNLNIKNHSNFKKIYKSQNLLKKLLKKNSLKNYLNNHSNISYKKKIFKSYKNYPKSQLTLKIILTITHTGTILSGINNSVTNTNRKNLTILDDMALTTNKTSIFNKLLKCPIVVCSSSTTTNQKNEGFFLRSSFLRRSTPLNFIKKQSNLARKNLSSMESLKNEYYGAPKFDYKRQQSTYDNVLS